MKKVSVIIPVYNQADTLSRCISSVHTQTYTNLQILLLDDGSTDHSIDLCKKEAEKDSRIEIYSHANHGVSYTRNKGIHLAKGDYIIFIDADDEIPPNYIENYVHALEYSGADIAIGSIRMIDDKGNSKLLSPPSGIYDMHDFFVIVCKEASGIYGYTPNKIYKSPFLKKNNILFNTAIAAQEDLDFALTAFSYAQKIALFGGTEYYYYHTYSKRGIPTKTLLKNMIKLYNLACSHRVEEEVANLIRDKIHNAIFTFLYQDPSMGELHSIRDLDGLDHFLKNISSANSEVLMANFLFGKRCYKIIRLYFSMRSLVKKLIGKRGGR